MGRVYQVDVAEVGWGDGYDSTYPPTEADGCRGDLSDESLSAGGQDSSQKEIGEEHSRGEKSGDDPFNLMAIITEEAKNGKADVVRGENVGVNVVANEQFKYPPVTAILEGSGGRSASQRAGPSSSEVGSSAVGSSVGASPVAVHNSFAPLESSDVDPQYPPGFAPARDNAESFATASLVSSSPEASPMCPSNDSQYTQFLECRLARAISRARVSTRKKPKKSNASRRLNLSQPAKDGTTRGEGFRLTRTLTPTPSRLNTVCIDHELEVPNATTALSASQEAGHTVAMGDALGWDRTDNVEKTVAMAESLIVKEHAEWSNAKRDV